MADGREFTFTNICDANQTQIFRSSSHSEIPDRIKGKSIRTRGIDLGVLGITRKQSMEGGYMRTRRGLERPTQGSPYVPALICAEEIGGWGRG